MANHFTKNAGPKFYGSIIAAVLGIVTYTVYNRSKMSQQDIINNLYEKFWDWRLKVSPEFGTLIGYHKYDHLIDEYSLESFLEREKVAWGYILEAQNLINTLTLDAASQENLKLFIADINEFVKGLVYKGYLFPINRMEGIHIESPLIVSAMMYKTAADYEKLISRLKLKPIQIDEIILLLEEGIKSKMTNHAVSMKDVLDPFDKLETDVEASPFYKPALDMPKDIDELTRGKITKDLKKVILEDVMPAFRKLRKFLETKYFKHLRSEVGVSSFPNGADYYKMCLRFHLGFDMTPEEVHKIGIREVERIKEKMSLVIKKLGFDISIKEFATKLLSKEESYFKTESEVLSKYNEILDKKIRPKLPGILKTFPKSKLVIEPTPLSMSSGPGAYYLAGTLAGKPGVFYVNTDRMDKNPKHTMMTLALHEAEPGHHLQMSLMMEQENLPEFRAYIEDRKYSDVPSRFPLHTAYIEGWGLYSEFLGYELDLYEDPYDEFGHLSYEMFRACRLVVDTGIHMFGWSRDKAIDFMVDNTAMHRGELENEVDRYITWPGQACAYKIGQLKIKELREKATKELGSKFDIKEFHDVVLKSPGPLSVLSQNVELYIKLQSSS